MLGSGEKDNSARRFWLSRGVVTVSGEEAGLALKRHIGSADLALLPALWSRD